MKERPISFSPPMVMAIQENLKTMTRRTRGLKEINQDPDAWRFIRTEEGIYSFLHKDGGKKSIFCPYGIPGDRLWVKEALIRKTNRSRSMAFYATDDEPVLIGGSGIDDVLKWKWERDYLPATFMPRFAGRYLLEEISIRTERLQRITPCDCMKEGLRTFMRGSGACSDLLVQFESLWNRINFKKYPWKSNIHVWVIEFKRSVRE
ncbi:hypothetical protein SAMN04489760_110115 [Syntrophus gentianae]|uniref:Uncharacterized protein n=1 Tax=Syntrophus gentianae TaxID=43775 RepID=A0A1H7XIW4_9BACT|nr:hypothetical protein [Syntrophus gentianae]SEM32969.1 hypothetical protein SAMN04489760_110115 [Syntrophus gentianae]